MVCHGLSSSTHQNVRTLNVIFSWFELGHLSTFMKTQLFFMVWARPPINMYENSVVVAWFEFGHLSSCTTTLWFSHDLSSVTYQNVWKLNVFVHGLSSVTYQKVWRLIGFSWFELHHLSKCKKTKWFLHGLSSVTYQHVRKLSGFSWFELGNLSTCMKTQWFVIV